MANAMYDKGRENYLAGNIDWDADNIKVVLIDEGTDAPVLTTDDALDDITAGARIATSGNLSSKTGTDGTADAADETINTVSGASVDSLTVYSDSGVESTSYLHCNIDTATGLPLTPNGSNVTIAWNASGIYTL